MVEFNFTCNVCQLTISVLVLMVSVNLGTSFNVERKELSKHLLRRAKRSDGGCIERSTYRSDIFPYMKVPEIKCKKGCHGVVEEVRYAVIMTERRVVGCRKTKNLPNSSPKKSPGSTPLVIGCSRGYTAKKVKITTLQEKGDSLVAVEKEIIIDCV